MQTDSTNTTLPKGLLVVLHSHQQPLPQEIVYQAMPKAFQHLRVTYCTLHLETATSDLGNYPWPVVLSEQSRKVQQTLQRKLDQLPDHAVLYFGKVPAPLAAHLGHRLADRTQTFVFFESSPGNWSWQESKSGKLLESGAPTEPCRGTHELVVRMGINRPVSEEAHPHFVAQPSRIINYQPELIGQHLLQHHQDAVAYAQLFRQLLQTIEERLPNTHRLHLFAAVPAGLAFLFGQQIRKDYPVEIHWYAPPKFMESTHQFTLVLNAPPDTNAYHVSEDQAQKAEKLRIQLRHHFTHEISAYQALVGEEPEMNWFSALFPDSAVHSFREGPWQHLPRLDELSLSDAFLFPDFETDLKFLQAGRESLTYNDARVRQLRRHLREESDQFMATRLHGFRVALLQHFATTDDKECYSKAHPEARQHLDYAADVYALLHEYHYQRLPLLQVRTFFCNAVSVLLNGLWASDKLRLQPHLMDQHRSHRYLTWYLLLEVLSKNEPTQPETIFNLLTEPPVLSLANHAHRLPPLEQFNFRQLKVDHLSLCLYWQGQLHTLDARSDHRILQRLLHGFRESEPEKLQEAMQELRQRLPPLPLET